MAATSDIAPSLWNTRAAVLIAAVAVFIGTLIFYTPTSWAFECVVLLTDGVLALAWIAGAAALGATILNAFGLRSNPMLHLATAAGLGLGLFSLFALGLGLLGTLNRVTALALPIISAALFFIQELSHRHEKPSFSLSQWLRAPAGISWLWLIPVVSLATAALAASIMPGDLWKPLDPHPYDVLSYHLQVPREWYEAGRIIPLRHNVFSYFPFNVEMQFLLLMHAFGGPWKAMYICQLLNVGYAALMVLTVAGYAETRAQAAIAAAVVSCVPWVIMLASVAYVESALMLYTALALVWAMRSLRSSTEPTEPSGSARLSSPKSAAGSLHSQFSDRRAIFLAGLFAGFAAGVKITAVPMLLLAIPLSLIVAWASRPWFKKKDMGKMPMPQNPLKLCAIFILAGALTLSPWLFRNIVWARNPIFPIAMKILGQAHFSDRQVERFEVAHSPTAAEHSLGARLQITWTDVLAHPQYGYILLPLGLLAAASSWRDRNTWLLLVIGAIIFLVWIGFTHLLARFLVMLIPVAALLVARVKWHPIVIIVTLLAAYLGWNVVYSRLAQTTRDPVRSVLIGVEDLSFTIPPELSEMKTSSKQVALIGDAGAFLYQIPMTRLHYRTVFDLPADEPNPIAAWAGAGIRNNPDSLLVIAPAEIERLHRTYLYVPPLPPDWNSPGLQPFVLNRSTK